MFAAVSVDTGICCSAPLALPTRRIHVVNDTIHEVSELFHDTLRASRPISSANTARKQVGYTTIFAHDQVTQQLLVDPMGESNCRSRGKTMEDLNAWRRVMWLRYRSCCRGPLQGFYLYCGEV